MDDQDEMQQFLTRKRERDVKYHFTPNYSKGRVKKKGRSVPQTDIGGAERGAEGGTEEDAEGNSADLTAVSTSRGTVMVTNIELSEALTYHQMLIASQAICCTRWTIVMAKLKTSHRLNMRSFVAIVKLNGDLHCSCSPDTLELALTAKQHGLASDGGNPCIHIDVALELEAVIGLEEWVEPEDRVEEEHDYSIMSRHQVIDLDGGAKLIYVDRQFGTVVGSRCDCVSHRSSCPFVKFAESADGNGTWETAVLQRQTAVSWKSIEFLLLESYDGEVSYLESDSCSKCNGKDVVALPDRKEIIPLYSLKGEIQCSVVPAFCSICSVVVYPDGKTQQALNMGNYLVSHAILHGYVKAFVTSGMTLFCYHKVVAWEWTARGLPGISYHRLRLAWIAFQKLMDFGAPMEDNFECIQCGRSPRQIVCDGITLSFQKRYLTEVLHQEMSGDNSGLLSGSSYDSRIMISSASLRKKLRSGSVIDDDLINLVESEQENWLKPVLLEFNGVELSKLPSAWKQLMRDISASTPAIGLVDPTKDISVICQQLIDDPVSASLLAEVKAAIPTIYNLLRVDICVVKLIKPLLLHLREKVSQIMSYQPHSLPDIPQAESSAEKKPHTLPRLPQLHQRGSYELDRKKKVTVCTKKAPKHRTLTPGIFTISCMHGVCYGFSVMENHESPNMPFTLIRTRFVEAPELIIYDNCCNLHDYCLNRDPGFFRHTKFCVDRFHWYNHKDCSSGYNIRTLEKYNGLNTQAAEQINSKLGKLRSLVSYSNEENFKRSVLLYIWFSNTINLLKLREARSDIEARIKRMLPLYTSDYTHK